MTFLLAGGGGLLSFNPGFALWILISMIVFIWVMMKYAVPPIMEALTSREAKIKDSLESESVTFPKILPALLAKIKEAKKKYIPRSLLFLK